MPNDIDKLTRCVKRTEIKSMKSLIMFIGKLSYPVTTPFLNDLTTAIIYCSVAGSKNKVFGKLPVRKDVWEVATVDNFLDKLGPVFAKTIAKMIGSFERVWAVIIINYKGCYFVVYFYWLLHSRCSWVFAMRNKWLNLFLNLLYRSILTAVGEFK